ncbi:hypothetical protein T492DRAFT_954603 [Pavlovales sp. CCMP2436]|nr:hypothetical protein T492DRAFT_954603 [Pavlovales sp. CCMP2436]|mmetsp:Transcript_4528/g.11637  ORF Transcript_4528/g.11637 Transcript_4528/m.11637 type:complete len:277 (-) Transcript_4528:152-982(-)
MSSSVRLITTALVTLLLLVPAKAFSAVPRLVTVHTPLRSSGSPGLEAFSAAPRLVTARTPLRPSDSLRMSGDDADAAEAANGPAEPAPAPASPGMYDLSKLQNSDGGGFNKFDPVLSASSFISRRFGIVGGLALVAVLAATEGNEIFKSLTSTGPVAGTGETVTLPDGLSYIDLMVATQGDSVLPGNVIGIHAVVSVGDTKLFDTHTDKPIAYTYGKRPYPNLVCTGVEEGLRGMKVGGIRQLSIPQALAPSGVTLPPGVALTYVLELTEILPAYF